MSTRDVYERQFDESCGKSCGNASCPECGGQVITDAGERRCQSCGLIIDGHGIDHGPEWRSFEREERRRVGAPRTPTRHDHGLATEIGRHVDANGTPIPGERRQQLSRLRTQHSRSRYQSSRERRLAHGLDEVRRLAGVLDLPDGVDIGPLSTGERRRYLEGTLEPGEDVYLLGTARETETGWDNRGYVIDEPTSDGDFILSDKSEATLIEEGRSSGLVFLAAGALMIVIGLASLLSPFLPI
ncbi:TFIIB-type zinc ribbon-containing protein [Haloferax sulfurifontis]|uniref:TFIIB-type zinc ribbon-containing protein n=1 Tax=Haloferax sulfurifontis TaxID=255616 RepID=UPI0030845849